MLTVSAMGALGAAAIEGAAGELGRGAIFGAFFVGAAFLAGFAVFRRGAAAVCAFIMVAAAAAMQFGALGLIQYSSPAVLVLVQGVFGAAALIFLSSVIRAARENALLGGVLFAAAISFVGLGVINLVGRGDASGLMRWSLIGVGVFAAVISAVQAPRDRGARLVLPGALIALAAPFVGQFFAGSAAALAPHVFFTLGVLGASLVALTETAPRRVPDHALRVAPEPAPVATTSFAEAEEPAPAAPSYEELARLSENRLAQVLDYSGVAVWDWRPFGAHQTDGLPALVGAQSDEPVSPEALGRFIHKDDVDRYERRVLGADAPGDGGFDVVLKLHDGRHVRLRGARAVDETGAIERLVAFVERAPEPNRAVRAAAKTDAAAFAAAAPAAASPMRGPRAAAVASAIGRGEIVAAFQPIVALETGVVAGYEALARWPGGEARAEEIVRAAEAAGKGGALARLMLEASVAHLSERMAAEGRRDLFVAMNLSFSQMREAAFADALKTAMAARDLPAKSVVLELTESQAITDDAAAGETFRRLKDAGAALAFDDFGAGFSSLSNLRKFAFDYLKIDKSFVDGLVAGEEGGKIARALASLGRDLGLEVIAEGVESKETAEAARAAGCAFGQGFALGAPEAGSQAAAEQPAAPVLAEAGEPEPVAAAGGAAAPALDKWRRKMR